MAVQTKKNGKAVVKSTKTIAQEDLYKIGEYFKHNHMVQPDPKTLQRSVFFFIIYYFCSQGRENLNDVEVDWFERSQCVIQQKRQER